MSFKIKAAAVTVATSLIAVPLALSGTAFAQDEPRAGLIKGHVFNDYNGDGVQQGNEPGIADTGVNVKLPSGAIRLSMTDAKGFWAVLPAEKGPYEVSYFDADLAATTPTTGKVEVTEEFAGAVIDFGVRGGSICGVAWSDTDEDGVHQAGEPALAGRQIYLEETDKTVETGVDGGYCFDNLRPGAYGLSVTGKAGDPLVLTRPNGDSKFDWSTTKSYVYTIGKGEHLKGIDAGFVTLRPDLKAVRIAVTNENPLKVGDTLDIVGSLVANGNAPESLSGTLTLPEGLRIVGTTGDIGYGAIVQGRQVILTNGLRPSPGIEFTLGAQVVVEQGFTGGEIKWEVGNGNADTDPSNNVLTRKIDAAPAQPQPQRPAPKGPEVRTAALANTGADPVATGAIGFGALVLGGLALFGARRRSA
ncbi:SdrD B-like domain-containing protein [Lentzea sp. NPDC006480]|uniref:SdrD B-like domain-containing protein n=1 Tax=Lentzea sp. NPDC006480 TaxID=3157176 RepID=UPI0033A814B9